MKPGRNDLCPCGSGKKYKKCCYFKEQNTVVENRISSDVQERFITGLNNLRRIFLDEKPHIKAYYKARKIHSEIVNAMIQYHHDGKFERQIETNTVSKTKPENICLLESGFNLETDEGAQAFYDMLIYKTTRNMSCITEDFIRNHRYKKPEKIEFLYSMLDSKLGLFEVTGTDIKEGYVNIKDMINGAEYTIIDIGLSGQQYYENFCFYTRIISYHGICFSTGLNFVFTKSNNFIRSHIQKHKKDLNPDLEFMRFTQLYNYYSKQRNKVKVITNKF